MSGIHGPYSDSEGVYIIVYGNREDVEDREHGKRRVKQLTHAHDADYLQQ